MAPHARDKYEMLHKVGQGAYGEVWKAVIKETGQEVAIKDIKLQKSTDGVERSAIDEIRLMQELAHPNILTLFEVFAAREGTLSLVTDFMQTDLEIILKAKKDPFIPLLPDEVKAYMKMFLSGVAFCHENFVLHRDLKPANLLIGADGVLKLCDFGLARTFGSSNAKYSHEAITLWYRPMEMLLGAQQYGAACDMWGVGCIFGELLLRAPLFATDEGASDLRQVQRIVEFMGSPSEKTWPGMSQLPISVKFKNIPAASYRQVFSTATPDAMDLLFKFLRYDPKTRFSATEALEHGYITAGDPPAPLSNIAKRVLELNEAKAQEKEAAASFAAQVAAAGVGHKRKAGD